MRGVEREEGGGWEGRGWGLGGGLGGREGKGRGGGFGAWEGGRREGERREGEGAGVVRQYEPHLHIVLRHLQGLHGNLGQGLVRRGAVTTSLHQGTGLRLWLGVSGWV